MAKKKRKLNRSERQKRQENKANEEFEAVVSDTAATFTCANELSADLAWQCSHWNDQLETDLRFNQLAYEFWQESKINVPALVPTLRDLVAEQARHQAALTDLKARFDAIKQQDIHEHLGPIEIYRQRVRHSMSQDPKFDISKSEPDRPSDFDEF